MFKLLSLRKKIIQRLDHIGQLPEIAEKVSDTILTLNRICLHLGKIYLII